MFLDNKMIRVCRNFGWLKTKEGRCASERFGPELILSLCTDNPPPPKAYPRKKKEKIVTNDKDDKLAGGY
jgi:hypothetical protein